jgi:cytidylate kinase
MPVITISRQFGAAGAPVGRELAKRFGAELLDRGIVAQVAVRLGVPESELESYDERVPSVWQRIVAALAAGSPEVSMPALPPEQMSALSMHDRLVTITRSVIEEAAQRGNVVILGRGGAFVLGRRPDVLHVHLHASLEQRVHYLLTRLDEAPDVTRPDEPTLRRLCTEIDATRGDYIRRLYGADWLDTSNYDLTVDSGRLGIAGTVDLIEAAARRLPLTDETWAG